MDNDEVELQPGWEMWEPADFGLGEVFDAWQKTEGMRPFPDVHPVWSYEHGCSAVRASHIPLCLITTFNIGWCYYVEVGEAQVDRYEDRREE
jgi:hypothetical protein